MGGSSYVLKDRSGYAKQEQVQKKKKIDRSMHTAFDTDNESGFFN